MVWLKVGTELKMIYFCKKKERAYKSEYGRLSLNGHLYKTDTSVKRTPGVGPCFSL